jgi:hypothetical protein
MAGYLEDTRELNHSKMFSFSGTYKMNFIRLLSIQLDPTGSDD